MKTIYYTGSNMQLPTRYAATVGFFDGVHRGHQYLIGRLRAEAASRGLGTMVVTFERHPRQVLHPEWQPRLLTTLAEKARLIEALGVDVLTVLRFDAELARNSASVFMQRVLNCDLTVALLLTGYDNRFGHDRAEGFADYQRYGCQMGMEVLLGEPQSECGERFSSSLVRQLVAQGRMDEAARCLGRPYSLHGTVEHGEQIGRRLGFPTANMLPDDPLRLVPESGVYAVRVRLDHDPQSYMGVTNIGQRPTFGGTRQTLETHILDFQADLYGRSFTTEFITRLRSEQHFSSPEALARQMAADALQARTLLNPTQQ